MSIARQELAKNVSAATNKHVTIEELMEVLISIQFLQKLYREDT
jgi:hypothetical protein